jgi:DNA-binding MarR family transcriptional regulator
MPESVLGDLSEIRVFDVLKPLLIEKKTGRVAFKGQEEGEIYVELGNISHAKTKNSVGEYAFFAIMEWNNGTIIFETDIFPTERTISTPTEQLLLNWSYRKQEWEKIKEVLPSANLVFRLALQKGGEDKNISADQWNVLALSNGVRTVAEITRTLNWDEYKTLRTVYQLIRMGLLERGEVPKPVKKRPAGELFFAMLENEFKKMMGPVAPFIIEDTLAELGETEDSLPQDRALSFVETLSEEIPDPRKAKEFVRVMREFLSLGK